MEKGNSSQQNQSIPNTQYPYNFSSSQSSSQIFGYTPNFAFHPQTPNSQISQNLPQFAHIFQPSQFTQPSQMHMNIQNAHFPGNMQHSQYPPFSTQGDHEVTIIPPPKKSESGRRTPWSMEDDKMLARAHATIGQDEKVGNEQKGAKFWARIEQYYHDNHPNLLVRRSQEKLKQHWHLIRARTHEFHVIYCKWQLMRRSGENDADIICRATEEYKRTHDREKFGYEHVWAICKDLPSWAPSFVLRQQSVSLSSTDNASSASVNGSVSGSEEVMPRPMGKKAAKRKAKERYTGDWQYADELQQSVNRQVQLMETIQKKRIEEYEFKRRHTEYETVMKDTSNMTPDQLATHLEYVDLIKQRWASEKNK